MEIPYMPWCFDRAGSAGDSRITPPAMLPSDLLNGVGTTVSLISRLNSLACTYPCQRFAYALTVLTVVLDDDVEVGVRHRGC